MLLISNASATTMPNKERQLAKRRENSNKAPKTPSQIAREEIAEEQYLSDTIDKEIEDIASEEIAAGGNKKIIREILDGEFKRRIARFHERKNEILTYSTKADLKKMRKARKRRQAKRQVYLLFWRSRRDERLAKKRGNSNTNSNKAPKTPSQIAREEIAEEQYLSDTIDKEIEDIASEEIAAGGNKKIIREILDGEFKRRIARFHERKNEVLTYSTKADLEKMRKARKRRQAKRQVYLLFWRSRRDERLAKIGANKIIAKIDDIMAEHRLARNVVEGKN